MSNKNQVDGPNPRKEPLFPGPLSLENLEAAFAGCADFSKRQMYLHGDRERMVTVCYLLPFPGAAR